MKTLNAINGGTLMEAELKPPDFVVDTLLAMGLHILAGSPKVGKSRHAVSVAKGESVWGMATKQGATLCLCLEDADRPSRSTPEAGSSVRRSTRPRRRRWIRRPGLPLLQNLRFRASFSSFTPHFSVLFACQKAQLDRTQKGRG